MVKEEAAGDAPTDTRLVFYSNKYPENNNVILPKPIKLSASSMTRICKLEACANHKFHVAKSFGSVGYLTHSQ